MSSDGFGKKVLFMNPSLDHTQKFPTSHRGRQIYEQQMTKKKHLILREIAKTHGLFFFFMNGCQFCDEFAPTAKHFSNLYGFKMMAISADGQQNKHFPKAKANNGIIQKLGIQNFPTLIALNPETGKMIPLAVGFSSLTDIETRAAALWDGEVR